MDSDPYGGYSVSVPGLGIDLGFQEDETYAKPVWLGAEHDQQPMPHLDIKVDDRQKAIDYVLSIGAAMPEKQLLRQLLAGEYTVLEGRCIERRKSMFSGYLHIVIEDGELRAISVRLKKKTAERILVDRSYRMYFMGVLEMPRDMSEARFWALEEV